MRASDIPTKFNIPFANNAAIGYIRPIPQASQPGGAASLYDGFPQICFLAVGAGGIPPDGEDFNGILNQISAWSRWQNAGATVGYDSVFSAAVGGYPAGALLLAAAVAPATSGTFLWLSTVDNNTTNPDTGGAGWIAFGANATRIITAPGAFTIGLTDSSIGFNRTTLASSSGTLPSGASVGQEFWIEDLAGNFPEYPVSVAAPGGMTIAGVATWQCNVRRQCARFKFYGSNLWSVKV